MIRYELISEPLKDGSYRKGATFSDTEMKAMLHDRSITKGAILKFGDKELIVKENKGKLELKPTIKLVGKI